MAKAKKKGDKSIKIGTFDSNKHLTPLNVLGFISTLNKFNNINNVEGTPSTLFQSYADTNVIDKTDSSTAYATFGKKSGLCNGNMVLSPIGELLLSERIEIHEYEFLLLCKQWVWLDDSKVSLLKTFYAAFHDDGIKLPEKSKVKDASESAEADGSEIEAVESEAVESPKKTEKKNFGDYFSAAVGPKFSSILGVNENEVTNRLEFFRTALLISRLCIIKDNILQINPDAIDVWEMIISSDFSKPIDDPSSDEYYDYLGNMTNGIFEIDNIEPIKELYPNLYNIKYLQEMNQLQQISYGAPGTGKSFGIDGKIKEIYPTKETEMGKVFRTTFHPDSDYSTFVGCYKPTMVNKERLYTKGELISLLTKVKDSGITYPLHKFATKYWESLKVMSTDEIKDIIKSCGFTDSMTVEVSKAVSVGEALSHNAEEKKIVYEFVPQTFTNAYIEAWRDLTKPVFLVIEEINRGNCAQIFGDLFQLLDRNEGGFSTYPIKPDTDLGVYISDKFEEEGVTSTKYTSIISGEELILPPNLHIWATMNTSDQSLFPIDSAFKRRWDWKYVPINTKAKSGWKIVVDGKNYSWSSFLDKINDEIDTTTSSEDKQLGFFFCKADDTDKDDNNGTISAEKFVGKVLFYIYNDVFKDYGLDQEFFKDKENAGKKISFRSLFKMNGDINESQVVKILDNLGVEIVEEDFDEEYEDGEEYEDEGARVSDTNAPYRVTFPDGEIICEGSGWETYVASLQKIGLDKALPFGEMYSRLNKTLPLITKKKIADQGVYKYYEVDGFYVLSGTDSQHRLLKRMNKDLNLGLTIE